MLDPYEDRRLIPDRRARDLVARMTLEEKFWQLFMIPGDLDNPAHDYSAGSFGLQITVRPESVTRRDTVPMRDAAPVARFRV